MRKATNIELRELLDYVVATKYIDPTPADIGEEAAYLDNTCIGVFDDYITDCPGYAGKVMIVVWGGSPSFTETFIWQREIIPESEEKDSMKVRFGDKKLTKVEIEV